MTTLPDLWVPPVSANPTHSFRGAGVTPWAAVTIENDTALQLLVSQNPDSPPSTDVSTAWRLVPPGANVTWPLGTMGVSYRLLGTPAASTAVQTILSDQQAPAGGTTGTVNVQSGNLTVTGPVNVQTAGSVNLQTSAGLATQSTFGINAGTTTSTITLQNNVQKLFLLYSGSGATITVTVTGATTGSRYFRGPLAGFDSIEVAVAGISNGTGTSVDTQLTVTVVSGPGGGQLDVVQSLAQPALSANDILPTSFAAAVTTTNKNLAVFDAAGKQVINQRPTGLGILNLIPAPGIGFTISLQYATLTCEVTTPNSICTIQSNGIVVSLFTVSNAGGAASFDFKGLPVGENRGVDSNTVASAAAWNITIGYSVLALA